jgi:thiamine kinase-like enzyme
MYNVKHILKTHFCINCINITEIYGGLSTTNYRVKANDKTYLLKVYDRKKSQASIWIENIDTYMQVLVWLNENTEIQGRIVRPAKTNLGNFRSDDDNNIFLLFDYIEGEPIGLTMTQAQVAEAAEIIACLHNSGSKIPINMDKIKEDFSVPFCISLERFLTECYKSSPADVKSILDHYLEQLVVKNNKVKLLSERYKQNNTEMVLCHTDAHGWNLIQSTHLVLIDWEGIRLAPPEADLIMFSKKEYWDTFIKHYNMLRPSFAVDTDLFSFYILRRKIDDIWAFLESLLSDNLSYEQRKRDLDFLADCCRKLDDLSFEL